MRIAEMVLGTFVVCAASVGISFAVVSWSGAGFRDMPLFAVVLGGSAALGGMIFSIVHMVRIE